MEEKKKRVVPSFLQRSHLSPSMLNTITSRKQASKRLRTGENKEKKKKSAVHVSALYYSYTLSIHTQTSPLFKTLILIQNHTSVFDADSGSVSRSGSVIFIPNLFPPLPHTLELNRSRNSNRNTNTNTNRKKRGNINITSSITITLS